MKKRFTEEQIIKAIKEHEAGVKVAAHFFNKHQFSERSACRLAGISRTAYRYQLKPKDDDALRSRLLDLAVKHKALGCPMLHGMLKTEGLVVNIKRTYRVYTEQGLQLRKRKKKKLTHPRMPLMVPMASNVRWSMDFVSDQLANGKGFRILNVKDD